VLLGALFSLVTAIAPAEVAQRDGVRVSVRGRIEPHRLPRKRTAPIAVVIAGRIKSTVRGQLPQLQRIAIAMNGNGHLDYRGLPRCRRGQIQPSTSGDALAACRRALVGTGTFSSDIRLPEESPFPSEGHILAFNGRYHGRPAILAHIYGTDPAPTSYVLPFTIRHTHGTFGAVLDAYLPQLTGTWGFVTGVSLTLGRGQGPAGRNYISAACPAPAGFDSVPFPLVRSTFSFTDGPELTTTVTRSCRVKQ
jgi:hypothetical protein